MQQASTVTLRRGQQRDYRGNWEVLAGVIAVIDGRDGHSVVGVAMRGEVISAPEGYCFEAMIDGTTIIATDQARDDRLILDFVRLRGLRDAEARIAAVRARLGGLRVTSDDFGRICGLNPGTIRHHEWRGV